jgi:hypothetical protein
MKVIRLKAENIKRLVAVEIAPDGAPVVVIRGKNGAGKTSVLDAIAMALGGKSLQPPKPIRQGADRAEVTVDLGDLVIKRTWTGDETSYLSVASKDGASYRSPQALLDQLVGRISFDPLAFTRLEPGKQAEALRSLLGLDFSALEARRRALYEERTLMARAVREAEAKLAGLPELDAPDDLVDLSVLAAAHRDAVTAIRAADARRQKLAERQSALGRRAATVGTLEGQVDAARAALARAEAALATAREDYRHEEDRVTAETIEVAAAPPPPDLEQLTEQIQHVEAVNARVRQKRDRARVQAGAAEGRDAVQTFTSHIEAIDAEKTKTLAGAAYPVPGLGFDAEGGLTFNGLPFAQASAAEQLRISVGVGLAMNPTIRVLLIRDGSLLDDANLTLLAEMAAARDAQLWIERVDGGVGVLIEDGAVVDTRS